MPYVCWIVVFGLFYGVFADRLCPGLPAIKLSPDVILYVFLPVLIFDSSRNLSLHMAKEEGVPAAVLASLGIVVSMFVMAVPIYCFTKLPWIHSLFFAAIMSATDPVAVTAIFKQFPIPGKLKSLLEGESLLNDGTTVILFALLSEHIFDGKPLSFSGALLFFGVSVGGAVILGLIGGFAGSLLLRRWRALKDHFIAPLLPLIVVYLVFCAAQAGFDISGVIAAMSATIFMRISLLRSPGVRELENKDRQYFRSIWEFLGELANAVLFFILGAEIGANIGGISLKIMTVVIVALLLSRCAVVYGFGAVFRLFRIRIPIAWQHVLNLGGLKGALSVALILMIPPTYIYRGEFLAAALALALFTMVGNSLAMRAYLKKADLS